MANTSLRPGTVRSGPTTIRSKYHLDAEPFEASGRSPAELRIEGPQHAVGRLDEDDASLAQVDAREVAAKYPREQFGEPAGELHACGSAADDHDVEQTVLDPEWVAVGSLHAGEDVRPDLDRISHRLQPERVLRHAGHAEGVRDRTRRQDEMVVGEAPTVVEVDKSFIEVNAGDRADHHRGVALPVEDPSRRVRDVVSIESRRGDLIEQRLERVVVSLVDEHDLHREAPQRLRRREAAESRPDDHDSMPALQLCDSVHKLGAYDVPLEPVRGFRGVRFDRDCEALQRPRAAPPAREHRGAAEGLTDA